MTKSFATPPVATPDDRATEELEAARTAAITRMHPSEVGEATGLQEQAPGAGDRLEQDNELDDDIAPDEVDIDVTLEEDEDLETGPALEQAPTRMASPKGDDENEEEQEKRQRG